MENKSAKRDKEYWKRIQEHGNNSEKLKKFMQAHDKVNDQIFKYAHKSMPKMQRLTSMLAGTPPKISQYRNNDYL